MSRFMILPHMIRLGIAVPAAVFAVENFNAQEVVTTTRKMPTDKYGKVRLAHFTVPALTVAGDDGSTYQLVDLPPGKIRVIPSLSRVWCSAYGAARVLDVGHAAYTKTEGEATEAADPDAFTPAGPFSVAAALNGAVLDATIRDFDIHSRKGVRVTGIVTGGTSPIGATLSGFIAYQDVN